VSQDAFLSWAGQPASPTAGVRAGRWLFWAALLLAGYLRFDTGAVWTGRLVAVGSLVVAVWVAFHATRPVVRAATARLNEPGAWEQLRVELTDQRRAQWETNYRPLGRRRYAIRIGRRYTGILAQFLYAALIVLVPTSAVRPTATPGLRFLFWLGAVTLAAAALGVSLAWRSWARAERGWAELAAHDSTPSIEMPRQPN
jgi:hypothetical protein